MQQESSGPSPTEIERIKLSPTKESENCDDAKIHVHCKSSLALGKVHLSVLLCKLHSQKTLAGYAVKTTGRKRLIAAGER